MMRSRLFSLLALGAAAAPPRFALRLAAGAADSGVTFSPGLSLESKIVT